MCQHHFLLYLEWLFQSPPDLPPPPIHLIYTPPALTASLRPLAVGCVLDSDWPRDQFARRLLAGKFDVRLSPFGFHLLTFKALFHG